MALTNARNSACICSHSDSRCPGCWHMWYL